jgi:hypothetical protein
MEIIPYNWAFDKSEDALVILLQEHKLRKTLEAS